MKIANRINKELTEAKPHKKVKAAAKQVLKKLRWAEEHEQKDGSIEIATARENYSQDDFEIEVKGAAEDNDVEFEFDHGKEFWLGYLYL